MALDQTRANEMLTFMHGGASPTALTAPMRVRILTAIGSATANGTEVATGGGYTAGAGAPTVTYAVATAGSQATNAAVTMTNYPRAESVAAIEIWDSTGTPKRVEYGAIAGGAKVMSAGDTLSFASGAITSAACLKHYSWPLPTLPQLQARLRPVCQLVLFPVML